MTRNTHNIQKFRVAEELHNSIKNKCQHNNNNNKMISTLNGTKLFL